MFCHLQPKACNDEFAGLHAERLKVRISAPPIDGKANKHLQAFIAKQFGVAKTAVTIVHGELGRLKTLRITQPRRIPSVLKIEKPL
ncbi:DUF167 family protein [Oceanicoccus sp. KOV_DT_Chl]|uniref:DUF167 family protein n=1 Tax=Oceanicoccus sp. KOV_DT_Chl TaxID=1904639 RepID=UPI002101684A|nr:DUF167 family protein [Oceanicoccus sp. KOV_DT_Chl]